MTFQPFDPHKEVRHYRTSMPHWRQNGCTYFVTYRLADSIPKHVVHGWENEKRKWLAARGVTLKGEEKWQDGFPRLSEQGKRDFIRYFSRELNEYLDRGTGACVLRNPKLAKIVAEGWAFFDGKRYVLGDLVVMPNHVHLLVTPLPGFELEDVLSTRKRQSAREINRVLGAEGKPLWQKHSYDHIVRNEMELGRFQKYIKENPQKAGLRDEEFFLRRFGW